MRPSEHWTALIKKGRPVHRLQVEGVPTGKQVIKIGEGLLLTVDKSNNYEYIREDEIAGKWNLIKENEQAGDRLRAARTALGLTIAQAAAKKGCSIVYWGDVERGKRNPTLDWLHEAAVAIGADPHDLDPRLTSTKNPPA